MINLIKCRKGVTLIELMVGLALCTIIIVAASGVMLPIMGVIRNVNDFSECNSLLNNLANHMTSDLYQSTEEPLFDEEVKNEVTITIKNDVEHVYEVSGGILYRDDTPVLGEEFYKNKSVEFAMSNSGDVYTLNITILSESGNEVLSRDYAVKPFMLSA